MFDAHFFDDLSKKLAKALPKGVKEACQDVEKNFHTILKSAFGKLDLVTREEFDAQVAVLQRTRKKVDELEKHLGVKAPEKKKSAKK
ncbi:MAG: accessory factor UbiK family protein [Gammaproteobacteria bacterium]|nr:accessory factor UbiK family protein [Gammaproteobacteria bacterium]